MTDESENRSETSKDAVVSPSVKKKSTDTGDDPYVAGWGRHSTPVKQMTGTGGLARYRCYKVSSLGPPFSSTGNPEHRGN
jgi:hypothetical protein